MHKIKMKFLDLEPIWSKEGPTAVIYCMDYVDLINPDGSRMTVSKKEDIDNLSEIIAQFRKENNIQTINYEKIKY